MRELSLSVLRHVSGGADGDDIVVHGTRVIWAPGFEYTGGSNALTEAEIQNIIDAQTQKDSVDADYDPPSDLHPSGPTDRDTVDEMIVIGVKQVAELTSQTGTEVGFLVYRNAAGNIVTSATLVSDSATGHPELAELINELGPENILAVVHSHPNGNLTQSPADIHALNVIKLHQEADTHQKGPYNRDFFLVKSVIVDSDGNSRTYR